MLQSTILILHVVVSLLIIALVLLQRGKGAEAGTGFGAGASGTVFGSRGSASFLSRATAAMATAFFITSLVLAFFANQGTAPPDSLLESTPVPQTGEQPQVAPPPDEQAPPQPAPGAGELPDLGGEAPPAGEGNN